MNVRDWLIDALQRRSGDHDQRLAAVVFVIAFVVLMLVLLLAFWKAGMVDVGR